MSGVTCKPFGKTKDGKEVFLYSLSAGKVTVKVINIGCSIREIHVPDKEGNTVDVNLACRHLQDYETNPAFLGSICGRVVNRIAKGQFTLDGTKYEVSKNDPLGNNICHGGFVGLTRRYFDGKIDGSKLVLTYADEDGAEGFPGEVKVTVTYEVTEEAGLMMDYKATTTKPTPIDLCNHFLVNLAGHDAGSIQDDHVVEINSSQKVEFDDKFIPTGKLMNLEGTVTDLRKQTPIADVIDKQPAGDGLHYCIALPGDRGTRKFVARLDHPSTKRYLEVHSTEAAMVVYSGHYLDFLLKGVKCKDDKVYAQSGGIVFMPHGYPDAINHPEFPSCILRPGETYHTTSWYKFGVAQ